MMSRQYIYSENCSRNFGCKWQDTDKNPGVLTSQLRQGTGRLLFSLQSTVDIQVGKKDNYKFETVIARKEL